MTIDEVLGCFPDARGSGSDNWQATCPAHDDSKPSLAIGVGADGRTLLHCHAGCTTEEVLDAVGLKMSDLYEEGTSGGGDIVAIYEYTDEAGNPISQVVRYEDKQFRQRRPEEPGDAPERVRDGFVWSLTKPDDSRVRRVLYRLPEVLEAKQQECPVFVVEGEKDADTLDKRGYTATCNPGGAGKWRPELGEALAGAEVVVIPDNDEPGVNHARDVVRSLVSHATQVQVLELPREMNGQSVKDTTEFFEAGGSEEQFEALMAQASDGQAWLERQCCPVDESSRVLGGPPTPSPVAAEPDSWESPVPLGDANDLPGFPVQVFPSWLRRFVETLATSIQTAADLPAMMLLAVLAMLLQGKVRVRIRDGWEEPVNLYTLTALPPAERKTAVVNYVIRPVSAWEQEQAERVRPAIESALRLRRREEEAIRRLSHRVSTASDDAQRQDLERQLADAEARLAAVVVPRVPRLLADDVTPERLSGLITENGGRMAVLSGESDLFQLIGGRYSKNGSSNFGVVLKAHGGDEIRVDRVSRPPEYVSSPALTLGLAVQPDVLKGMIRQHPEFQERGLPARFLYSFPESRVGYRETDAAPLDLAVQEAYEHHIRQLLALESRVGPDGHPEPQIITLTPDAFEQLSALSRWNEEAMRPGASPEDLRSWLGKLPGALARIAALLHVANVLEQEDSSAAFSPISGDAMEAATELYGYLVVHARKAFEVMGSGREQSDPEYLLTTITKRGLRSFTTQEIWQATRAHFSTMAPLDRALVVLLEHRYLRQVPRISPAATGRPSRPSFAVNPAVWRNGSGT